MAKKGALKLTSSSIYREAEIKMRVLAVIVTDNLSRPHPLHRLRVSPQKITKGNTFMKN